MRKTCYKTYFYSKIFGHIKKKQYLCTVFFMVLDLRLSKDWVVGMTILLFLYQFFLFARSRVRVIILFLMCFQGSSGRGFVRRCNLCLP